MTATSTFAVAARWQGGVDGFGHVRLGGDERAYSAPKELGGAGVGTNPEELLASAAASCYLITLAAVLARSGIAAAGLSVRSEITVATNGGLTVREIVHYPSIEMAEGATEPSGEALRAALARAEAYCLVGRAMHGNVPVRIAQVPPAAPAAMRPCEAGAAVSLG
jgi:peroxiredoxin-like protein